MTKRNRITALISAAGMLAALPQIPASALDPVPAAPDWVPTNYTEAVSFCNDYGLSRVDDGYICIVRQQTQTSGMRYEVQYSGMEQFDVVEDEIYRFVPPEDPGEQDGSKEYWEKLDEYERYQRALAMLGERGIANLPCYEVIVLMPEAVGELQVELTWTLEPAPGDENATIKTGSETLTFAMDGKKLVETDLRGWMPDCYGEYDAYLKENGVISVHEDRIVICADCNYSTGAELTIGQNGTPCELERSMRIFIEEELPIPVAGETSRLLQVYRPSGEGAAQFTVFVGRQWALEYPDDEGAKLIVIGKDGSLEMKDPVPGDLNADGLLDIADAVLLCKFLQAQGELNTAQIMLADLSGDRHVNAVDLTVMKRLLGSALIRIDDPVV